MGLAYSTSMKMEERGPFETMVHNYETTKGHIPAVGTITRPNTFHNQT